MTAWAIQLVGADARRETEGFVGYRLLEEIGYPAREAPSTYKFTSHAYEFAAFSGLEDLESETFRDTAELAFEAMRAAEGAERGGTEALHVLHTACYGVLADRTPDVARYLKSSMLPERPPAEADWGTYVRGSVYRLWLLLLRKDGWGDLDAVQEEVVALRAAQGQAEERYLSAQESPRATAWELVAAYHLSKAAELLGTFLSQGMAGGGFNIREQLEAQFDRSIIACERAELAEFYVTVKLLAATAERMVANSIWAVTRGAGGRISRFVNNLVSRASDKPLFEMLPPQRITLRTNGLLGSGHRAVVVSLPTSSGKTFIAQFRILQALNQFEVEQGWVVYIAPTRALVNQICAKMRRDFQALGIVVERVSPAMEIDGVEAELLLDPDRESAFRVLVGTPEKIDLLLRGGWEEKIGRPLTLVVVDEAHNISSGQRGLKLELLLATINRECRNSQFLLLTPFIENHEQVARWLSPDSHANMSVEYNWRPNDRAIVIVQPQKAERLGDFSIALSTVHTSKGTIEVEEDVSICSGRTLGLTWSRVSGSLSNVAAVTASCLNKRGPVIVVAGKVAHAWSIARTLADDPEPQREAQIRESNRHNGGEDDIAFVSDFVASEFGDDFELVGLLKKRIGLHHSGLSDDTRILMEWLVERGHIDSLVATTTIAQGVNFPVTSVVLASHQYPYGEEMPPEDFWNLAGRAGRADQAGTGLVALAATTPERAGILRDYAARNVSRLNSTLVRMVHDALEKSPVLELHSLYYLKEWSAFLQYLAHSYRQIGDHAEFSNQIEQVLRGSFGFQELRQHDRVVANHLVDAVRDYAAIIRGKPLSLVDSTGFSWESVSRALVGVTQAGIRADSWDAAAIFSPGDRTLERAFGVLFSIPEIRDELVDATGGQGPNGDLLARIVKDWVGGASMADLALNYFSRPGSSSTESITRACRAVHGKLTSTASWGISALQALTAGAAVDEMSDEERKTFRNLPSRIYYGVDSDAAIDLRLLGVPRNAAQPIADSLAQQRENGIGPLRRALESLRADEWEQALGNRGKVYRRAWRVIEGIE